MPLGTQARLLRVLEAGEYIRVGSSKVQKTDVRVIAATNKELLEYTQTGRFREDLILSFKHGSNKGTCITETGKKIFHYCSENLL